MKKVERFVIWICSKFDRAEIEVIIKDLSDILAGRNPGVKPKDEVKKNFLTIVTSPLILVRRLLNIPKILYLSRTGNNSSKNIKNKKGNH